MFCKSVKEFLSQNGVRYEDRDITVDPTAMKELEKHKLLTTPVVFVDGEMVVGFDRERLTVLLGLGSK